MSTDFRTLLKERLRNDQTGERWFDDLDINGIYYLSVQASTLHESKPSELLDDVSGYEAFEVTLQTQQGVFIHGRRGAWEELFEKSWWGLLEEESPILRTGSAVPVSTVQAIFEDLTAVAAAHPEYKTKRSGCGGCGSLKVN